MLRCTPKGIIYYNAYQWKGNNLQELMDATCDIARLGSSPYGDDQLTIKGGDSYYNIYLTDWLLISNNLDVLIVTDESFREHYEILE